MHMLLESQTDKEKFKTEERLVADFGDVKISGAFDLVDLENRILYDYKNTKIASVQDALNGKDDKWKKQMQFYSYLIEHHFGLRIETARIIAMCKDHSKVKASKDPDYQQTPIVMVEYDLSDRVDIDETVEEFRQKALEIKACLELDIPVMPCTYADMWCTEDYAVFKKGGTRAVKCFDTPVGAYEYYEKLSIPEDYQIMHRVSEPMNCKLYCQCRDVCPQWKRLRETDFSVKEDVTEMAKEETYPF